ncbi:MAG: hypothetical protein LBD51_05615, partial [Bifidobacteriaceae bacterium]|nr:hypothetical protein [Bifidobacteriaceae bacterium]
MGRHDLAGQRAFAQGEPVFALPTALQALRLAGPDAFALLSALTTLPPGALAAKGQSAAPGGRPPAASSPNLARGATGRPAPSRPPAIEGAVGAAGAVGAVGAAGAAGAVGAVGAA